MNEVTTQARADYEFNRGYDDFGRDHWDPDQNWIEAYREGWSCAMQTQFLDQKHGPECFGGSDY